MSLEALEQFVTESGNEEVVGAFNSVKEKYTSLESTNQKLSENIGFLEKESKKAFEKRDAITGLVKNTLGVDEISEEALKGIVEGKSNADVDNLTQMLNSLKQEKESIQSKYSDTVNSYKVEKELIKLGATEEAETSKAYDIILNEIKNGISFDNNGNAIYTDSEGATIRNSDGTPMSLADRYNQLKESDDMKFLFKTRRSKSGSGANNKGGSVTAKPKRSEMSASEKGKYIKEYGQEAYLGLPN